MSENFTFPEVDEVGIDTLDAISFAPRFNRYMYDTIQSHCSGKILEIGSGIGNISEHFVNAKADIALSDIRDNYLDELKLKYGQTVKTIIHLDLVHEDFENEYADHLTQYDSIFALNVVEHIKDDNQAILNAKKLLKKNGKLIILVPAYQALYNTFDTALEHFRRYNRKRLNTLMSAHLSVEHSQYFNVMGILGWVVSGKILKKKTIPRNQMELYDRLILVSKLLDKCVINKIGLSIISVGRKI